MPALPGTKGVQINDEIRLAFLSKLKKSRQMFITFTILLGIFVLLESLHTLDAFGIKRRNPEMGAVLDAIFVTSGLFAAFLGFGKYGRMRCPGCLHGMWTTNNPRFCPRCYQPFMIEPKA